MKFLVKNSNLFCFGLAVSILVTYMSVPALSQVIHFDQPAATATPKAATGTTAGAAASASTFAAATAAPAATAPAATAPAASAPPGPETLPAATAPAETVPVQDEAPAAVAPPAPKPPENVPPKGMPAAMKLFNSGKYAFAQKEFEKFVNTGVADEDTHMNLAYCLYYQRKYTQALKQFDWVNKNAKHSMSMQMKAQNTAAAIRSCMRGICPGSCLKPSDPRWQVIPSLGAGKWCKFTMSDGHGGTGWHAFSEGHMGDMIQMVDGKPTDMGPCPVCGGRGTVTPLKDGDALPGQ
jgi:hypothetical protein